MLSDTVGVFFVQTEIQVQIVYRRLIHVAKSGGAVDFKRMEAFYRSEQPRSIAICPY